MEGTQEQVSTTHQTQHEHVSSSDSWSRRRNRLYVRNGEMLVILLLALIAGVAATVLTAYLGVR